MLQMYQQYVLFIKPQTSTIRLKHELAIPQITFVRFHSHCVKTNPKIYTNYNGTSEL